MRKLQRMIAIAGLVIVVGLIILAAYLHFAKGFVWMKGTGLDQKTLWDWLQLLIVPVVLALGGFLFNHIQHNSDQRRAETDSEIAEDRQRETALQSYLDKMTDLLLEHNLVTPEVKAEVQNLARSRTLTTLRTLDPTRKGLLIGFLYESGLIKQMEPIVSLKKADLREADLHRTYLYGTDLSGADLSGADLSSAKLSGATLCEANLRGANLRGAILCEADLRGADLHGADLRGADLLGVDLRGADLLRSTMYNDKTQWPAGFDAQAAGAVLVP